MNKLLRISLSIIFIVLYIIICLIPTNTMTVSALNISVEGGYTTALEDLSTDKNFNSEDYAVIEDDYSLQVIQIAESSNNELFVYVYQPSADYGNLVASSINISADLHNELKIKNYKLTLLNKQGVFYKYIVNGLQVRDETTRYYEVISIYRPWDENIDEGIESTNENTIDEVVFRVAKQYTFATNENGHVNLSMTETEIETIEVTDKYVGFMRYKDGWHFFPNNYESCDSHFIAFSTNKPIDKLYEIDVYYTSQYYLFYMMGAPAYTTETVFTDPLDTYSYLNWQQQGSYKGDGLFAHSYNWDVIQSIDDFIKDENSERDNMFSMGLFNVGTQNTITDEGFEDLKSQQWVVRFAETEYSKVTTTDSLSESYTIIGDVTILRLAFETDGVYYNLPVIDNKQTGDGIPDNVQKPKLEINDMFKILLLLLLLIIIIVILAPFLPTIISIIFWIIKTAFKIVWWIISLPFKLFSKNKKKSRY